MAFVCMGMCAAWVEETRLAGMKCKPNYRSNDVPSH